MRNNLGKKKKLDMVKIADFRIVWLVGAVLILILGNGCSEDSEEGSSGVEAGPAVATLEDKVFELEEFSVLEYEGPLKRVLIDGQVGPHDRDGASEDVKAYPEVKSEKAWYGHVIFGRNGNKPNGGQQYFYVMDESNGTDEGYDRLYFDINHDLDLTNDPVLKATKINKTAKFKEYPEFQDVEIYFEPIELTFEFADGEQFEPQKILLRYTFEHVAPGAMSSGVYFLAPTARRGKIQLGDAEHEVILSQGKYVRGRYDQPSTSIYLDGKNELVSNLYKMYFGNGTFHTFSASPAGDRLTVSPYTGELGELRIGGEISRMGKVSISKGLLRSSDLRFIDIEKLSTDGGQVKLPAGDYAVEILGLESEALDITFAREILAPPQEKLSLKEYMINIRSDQPLLLDFADKMDVAFDQPQDQQRFKAGERLQVEAMITIFSTEVRLVGLNDKTQKISETIKLADGTEVQQYASLDPEVTIKNSAGQTVAEGPMPFG